MYRIKDSIPTVIEHQVQGGVRHRRQQGGDDSGRTKEQWQLGGKR